MLIGASLFMYNDWRDHRTLAAPNNSNNPPVVEDPTQTPLTLPDQSVSGNVTINPDGSVEQRSD